MLKKLSTSFALLILSSSLNAAAVIDLRHVANNNLHQQIANETDLKFQEIKRNVDLKNNLHVFTRQTYKGYSVWGSEAVFHVANNPKLSLSQILNLATKKNGRVYTNLAEDLNVYPSKIFTIEQLQLAESQIIDKLKKRGFRVANQKTKLIVFIDEALKAHWAFYIDIFAQASHGAPIKEISIVNAVDFSVYKHWNDAKTELTEEKGGGFGGNWKVGKRIDYFPVQRYPETQMCTYGTKGDEYAPNPITIQSYCGDIFYKCPYMEFYCSEFDEAKKVYWAGAIDPANGGYSPTNDTASALQKVQTMYMDLYHMPPVLNLFNEPLLIRALVHLQDANAMMINVDEYPGYGDLAILMIGDGNAKYYPFANTNIIAHELSHAFTHRFSGLVYEGQSGGLNESFSDMAAMAYESYADHKNSWMIGAEVVKNGTALRYIDNPRRDCIGTLKDKVCSIDHVNWYTPNLDVHYSSGIFNKAFYLISTSTDWNTIKAFNVMVQANQRYWLPTTSFAEAACGVIDATKDYGYSLKAIHAAFAQVGIDTTTCS